MDQRINRVSNSEVIDMSSFMKPQYLQDTWIEIDSSQGVVELPVSSVGRPTAWNGNTLRPGDVEGVTFEEAAEFYSDYLEAGIVDVYSIDEVISMRNTKGEKGQPVGCRLSAAGYMDCTPWTIFATMKEAREYIEGTYDVNADTGEGLE